MTQHTCIEQIDGKWFVGLDSTSIDGPLRFQDRGNGPELVTDGVEGPFDSEVEAQAWLDSYLEEWKTILVERERSELLRRARLRK